MTELTVNTALCIQPKNEQTTEVRGAVLTCKWRGTILEQNVRFCDKSFEIYRTQNFVRIFLDHPVLYSSGTLWDCMRVSFDPRERTICGLVTVAGGRCAAINVSAQPLNKQQV